VARAGLRADRPGRPVHGRGRLRHLRRRRLARPVAAQLLHHRADAQPRPPPVRRARRGELHDAQGAGTRADRVHAQPRPVVPPDRGARRSRRRALHRRLLQPGGHPQRHARPHHGPANAAVRPDRDHYFGRIWRVQHKEARRLDMPALDRQDLPGLVRAMETSPNAHVRQTAWRLAQENHPATPGSRRSRGRWGAGARGVRARAQRERRLPIAAPCSTCSCRPDDDWTRSAIVAGAADDHGGYLESAFAHPRRHRSSRSSRPWCRPRCPPRRPAAGGSPPGRHRQAAALKPIVVGAVARMEKGTARSNWTTPPGRRWSRSWAIRPPTRQPWPSWRGGTRAAILRRAREQRAPPRSAERADRRARRRPARRDRREPAAGAQTARRRPVGHRVDAGRRRRRPTR
jgi:hypothetical protein